MANSFYDPNNTTSGNIGGERVRVAMRVRPMMPHERDHENITQLPDPTHVILNLKSGAKQYRFNAVLNENC
jgi:hypothetical protein